MTWANVTGARRRMTTLALGAVLVTGGCATPGTGASSTPAPDQSEGQTPTTNLPWEIRTRPFMDLWLHGFGMLSNDSARVPLFRRGYRDELTVLKNQAHAYTLLDVNRDRLAGQYQANRELVNAQFVAMYFNTFGELQQAVGWFEQAQGDPSRANSQDIANTIALLNAYFPNDTDREWLRIFMQSLVDENQKFYQSYWRGEQAVRAQTLVAIDSLWTVYRPKFQGYLNGTQQADGDLYLALPLDGEGRTLTQGKTRNKMIVSFPEKREDAAQVIYVFAHEIAGAVVNTAVADNTTPNDKRLGIADRLQSFGQVRGGEMLLEKVAPELADGYARYYLTSASVRWTGDARAALVQAYPLPDVIRDGIKRQIDLVMGGI